MAAPFSWILHGRPATYPSDTASSQASRSVRPRHGRGAARRLAEPTVALATSGSDGGVHTPGFFRERSDPPGEFNLDPAHETHEPLPMIPVLGGGGTPALTLRAAGYSYREIQEPLGVSYTRVNRHVTEGRQALRRADAVADAEVEAAVREAA